MSASPRAIASKLSRAAAKQARSTGTPSRAASSRAMSTVTPAGATGVPCARTGLPRLIAARSTPFGAMSLLVSVTPLTTVNVPTVRGGTSAEVPPRMSRYLLAGQVGVVLPAVLRTAPRDRVGGAAQLRAGAVRVDVQAGGQVPQGAVRLRDELLERAGVAHGEDQAVTQRVGLPAAAGVGHAEPGTRAVRGVLELVGTRVRA